MPVKQFRLISSEFSLWDILNIIDALIEIQGCKDITVNRFTGEISGPVFAVV